MWFNLFNNNVKKFFFFPKIKLENKKEEEVIMENTLSFDSLPVIDDFLTINKYSRPGRKRPETLAVVLHWTANPNASAKANRDFFESKKDGKTSYGSTEYIVGLKGEIIRCMPDEEISYNCGTSSVDPISGKIYTDYAREKFGKYVLRPDIESPNSCTVAIEMCPIDWKGNFKPETWESTKKLVVCLLKKYNLGLNDITTHEKIVGYKFCPQLFHDHPEEFDRFVKEVGELLV